MFEVCSVSVIIPFFNASDTIALSLRSVLKQSLMPLEIIIVNDSSEHEEYMKLNAIVDGLDGSFLPISVYSIPENKGAAYCRNLAIKHAKGKYLAFLDSDDVWHCSKIKLQYNFMEKNNCFLSGHGYIHNLKNKSFVEFDDVPVRLVKKYVFSYRNPFFTPTVMVVKNGFKGFDESFRRVDDYKCWLENFKEKRFFYLNEKLAGGFKSPIGESGLTGSIVEMHKSYMLVLFSLYKEGYISRRFIFLSVSLEYIKYPLRLLLNIKQ
ncbi:glycosyltransferase family 2 protein [Marinomonas profundimaris]|uniref:Glycosyl transferase n=1 Tax=Marinomonas profundimaris TaxID=1208321 RepID=W1RWQ4_9GAMM|nr:glycosyltransferase family 2 protein [Marinomonas profundimaris]ETI61402.1 glycosyl transferase [Marinomonas profundimaris]